MKQSTKRWLAVLLMDTHAPQYIRMNENSQMMPEYAEAFGVEEGDGMYIRPEDRLTIRGK